MQKSGIKNMFGFRACSFLHSPVWLQAWQYLALAAQIPEEQKNGLSAPTQPRRQPAAGGGDGEPGRRVGCFVFEPGASSRLSCELRTRCEL